MKSLLFFGNGQLFKKHVLLLFVEAARDLNLFWCQGSTWLCLFVLTSRHNRKSVTIHFLGRCCDRWLNDSALNLTIFTFSLSFRCS